MKRKKRGKQTLKRKMLSILLLCAMSCILAVVIVSYMTIRMIRNDSIQESMQIYLEQITREMDNDYYDMIGIVNQMSPNGLIGSVTERYLSAEDNYDRYSEQKSLREELIKLGYVNTKLLGIAYFDPKEQKELIGNFNVRVLDPSYQTISKVVVGAENIMQAMHASYLGIRETPVLSVMRRVSFGNKRVLDIYAEIEPDMSVSDRLNKEKWPYTYMEMDEKGIVQYSNNPVIVRGQKLLSELPEKRRICCDTTGRIQNHGVSQFHRICQCHCTAGEYLSERNEYVETEVSGYHPGSFWYFFQFCFLPLPVDMQTPQSVSKTDDPGGKWIFTRGGTGV